MTVLLRWLQINYWDVEEHIKCPGTDTMYLVNQVKSSFTCSFPTELSYSNDLLFAVAMKKAGNAVLHRP